VIKKLEAANGAKRTFLIKTALFALAVLLYFLDDWTGPRFSFAIFYYIAIILSTIYVGGRFSYVIATITAFERVYGLYVDYPLNQNILTSLWDLVNYLPIHLFVCYLSLFYINTINFIRPTDNELLKREHLDFRGLKEFIFRPYIHSKWNMERRLAAISMHYTLVKKYVPYFDLAGDDYRDLAKIEANGMSLRVVIDRPKWMRREGELAISIFHGIDRIYTAMILLSGSKDDMKLIIGNIQGDGRNVTELYKQLTKAFHGMRPRDILINVVKMIGNEIECTELLGVSDATHRSVTLFSSAKKQADYDSIWSENGGFLNVESGFFSMHAKVTKRTTEEIPSNKRSLYRRRYQLLDEVQAEIKVKIGASTDLSRNHAMESTTVSSEVRAGQVP